MNGREGAGTRGVAAAEPSPRSPALSEEAPDTASPLAEPARGPGCSLPPLGSSMPGVSHRTILPLGSPTPTPGIVHSHPWDRPCRGVGSHNPTPRLAHSHPWDRSLLPLGLFTPTPGIVHSYPWDRSLLPLGSFTPTPGIVHSHPWDRPCRGVGSHNPTPGIAQSEGRDAVPCPGMSRAGGLGRDAPIALTYFCRINIHPAMGAASSHDRHGQQQRRAELDRRDHVHRLAGEGAAEEREDQRDGGGERHGLTDQQRAPRGRLRFLAPAHLHPPQHRPGARQRRLGHRLHALVEQRAGDETQLTAGRARC